MRARNLVALCCATLLMIIGLAPAANAASAYDNVIQLDSSLVLNGYDVSTSYYDDIKTWSTNNPGDTNLAAAVAAWDDAIDIGSGWALLKCPASVCGGGGYGQIIITPPTSYYSFFNHTVSPYDPYIGVSCADASCSEVYQIAFRYNTSGVMASAGVGAAATGTYFDGIDYYVALQSDVSNPSSMMRTIYINTPIFYPAGYEGAYPPAEYTPPTPQPYSGTVDCFGDDPQYMMIYQDGNDGAATLTYESLGRATWEYSLLPDIPYGIVVDCEGTLANSYRTVIPSSTSGDWVCDPYAVQYDQPYCVMS